MKVEIDQSNRVEETQKDTIIALSNNIEYTICIRAQTKRELLKILRRKEGSDKLIYINLFVAALVILLRQYRDDIKSIIIDIEYPGKELYIESRLKRLLVEENFKSSLQIVFKSIGKQSPAHYAAWSVHKKLRKPNWIAKSQELLRIISRLQ
ncbi:hypothetical protein HY407_01635 [Candidatus Gottesmanbacteria bacterium]|nr:hypothetical protein [Candidatus Gottesmanbacteria bacterium]